MRLITLGDSATHGDHSWAVKLSNTLGCELINFAQPASQDLLQMYLIQQWLLDNDFEKDDIIVWQIGYSKEPVVKISTEHLDKVQRASRLTLQRFKIIDHIFNYNRIDNSERISLLHVSPIFDKFVRRKASNDDPEVLQTLLFTLNILKKLCPRVLVIRGKDNFVSPDHWENMKIIFTEKGISFSDDSIVDWVIRNNLPVLADGYHPTEESMKTYAMKVIYPILQESGWV